MKNFKRKFKNFVLKSITAVAFIIFVICGCYLDAEIIIPQLIIMGGCGMWIMLFAIANGWVN